MSASKAAARKPAQKQEPKPAPARDQKRRPGRGWLLAGAGLLLAGGLAGYGIWSRSRTEADLKKNADDAAIPRVQVVAPKPGPAERTLSLPGNLEAWFQASIYGQVTGYVSRWDKDYGAEVKAGDLLATIDTPALDAQLGAARAQLATVQARYNLAVVTARRWSALSGTQAVSKQDVDVKKADEAAQKAEVAAAQQNVNRYEAMAAFKRVVAPFDGVVTARNTNIGDYVGAAGGDATSRGPSQALFTVADIHKLRVFVSVPQNFSDVLKPGLSATLALPQEPGKQIPAQFLTTARAVVPSTRTVVTELVLDNPKGEYWPGSYVSVRFTFPGEPNVLTVPEQAVLFRAQGTQVALLDGGGKVSLRDVTVGRNLGTEVQVLSGLAPGDKLVANPSLGLLDGQAVKVVQPAPGADPSGSPEAGKQQAGPSGGAGPQPAK